MIFYHATNYNNITCFDSHHNKKNTDFGHGLYLTNNINQAKEWAIKKGKENNIRVVYVSEFNLDSLNLNELKFNQNRNAFYDIFYLCRNETEDVLDDIIEDYNKIDILYGPVIKNSEKFKKYIDIFHGEYDNLKKIKNKIEYKNKQINSFDDLIDEITYFDDDNIQYCLKNDRVVNYFNMNIKEMLIISKSGKIIKKINLSFDNKKKEIIYQNN